MTQPEPGSLASAPIYEKMDKGDGTFCWVPVDNRDQYLSKGFVSTGETQNWYTSPLADATTRKD